MCDMKLIDVRLLKLLPLLISAIKPGTSSVLFDAPKVFSAK